MNKFEKFNERQCYKISELFSVANYVISMMECDSGVKSYVTNELVRLCERWQIEAYTYQSKSVEGLMSLVCQDIDAGAIFVLSTDDGPERVTLSYAEAIALANKYENLAAFNLYGKKIAERKITEILSSFF